MVIVVMSEVKSGRDRVALRVAEYLGWEFLDIEPPCTAESTSRSILEAQGPFPVELLRAALDSLIYAWRDVVLSCPVLTEKDQKHLRDNRSVVKFVYLKAADETDSKLRVNPSAEVSASGSSHTAELTPKYEKGALTLTSSMRMAQIVKAVLTEAVLREDAGL